MPVHRMTSSVVVPCTKSVNSTTRKAGHPGEKVASFPSSWPCLLLGHYADVLARSDRSHPIIYCSSAVLTNLPELFTVGILGRCSLDSFLVDLSTKPVAE